MHLLKLSVSHDVRMTRDIAMHDLPIYQVCTEDKVKESMPAERSKTDAVRAAASYVLQSYQNFEHNGRRCKILAANVASETKRGLDIQLNIREIAERKAQYSEEILRICAPHANSTPEIILQPAAQDFDRLVRALNIDTLIANGQNTLYDNDVRRLIETLLESYTVGLWKGLSLVLDPDGLQAIKRLQTFFDKELDSGTVTLSTLALDMSQANRAALARELAEEFIPQLEKLIERAGYPGPSIPAIEKAYESLTLKIDQAHSLLGIDIPCQYAQLALEQALMSAA